MVQINSKSSKIQANCSLRNWRTARTITSSRRPQLRPRQPLQRPNQRHTIEPRSKQRDGRLSPEHARPGANMEPQIQLPLDLHQRRALHRRIQTSNPSANKSQMRIPHHPQRALGRPQLDQQGPNARERRLPQSPRRTVRAHAILPPNVPMEQWLLLQTPRSARIPILLARGAQRTLLLRRRLRRLPLHARPQQNVRLHHHALRLPAEYRFPLARDDEVRGGQQ